jgi:hypothetical protein
MIFKIEIEQEEDGRWIDDIAEHTANRERLIIGQM